MIDGLRNMPSHLRKRLTNAIDTGLLTTPYATSSLRSVLGMHEGGEGIAGALVKLEQLGISGPAAAAWIRTVDEATSRTPRPDLVWSGPEVPGLHARDTRRVFEELLGSAERSVWASTYAFFDGPRAFQVLAQRMDARSNVSATLLLNIQRKRGDSGGLYLYVAPTGGRLWRMDRRHEDKRLTLSFGRYPITGLSDARAKRDDAKRQLAAGVLALLSA